MHLPVNLGWYRKAHKKLNYLKFAGVSDLKHFEIYASHNCIICSYKFMYVLNLLCVNFIPFSLRNFFVNFKL